MAVRIGDTLKQINNADFPIVEAMDVAFESGDTLQELYDSGALSGGGGSTAITITQEEYDALDSQEQLEGEFYCYDSARHFRNGVEYGKAVDISGKQDNLSQVKFTMRRNSASEGRYCLIGSSDLSQNLLMCEPYRFQGIFGDGTTSVENKSIIDFMVSFREGVGNPDEVLSGFANSSKGFEFVDLLITADETTNTAYAYVDFKTSGSVATGEITKPVLEAESYMDFAESFELTDTYIGTLVCKMSDYAKIITNIDDTQASTETTWSSEKIASELGAKVYTSLAELGLTAPTTVGEVFMAMPNKSMAILSCEAKDEADGTITVSDIPVSYGVLIIKKNGVGRFSIEYQNSSYNVSSNVKKWIGTLKGSDGTGLKWKELATMDNAIETIANPTELDTNKFLKSGYYSLGDATKRTNLPMQNVGTLLVYYAGHYVIQEYILNANLRRFMRRSTDKGANWSAWKELATIDNAIENVPPTNIAFNTDYVTKNDISISMYEIRNGICYVTMDVTSVVSADAGRVVCTLPKPSSQKQFTIPPYSSQSTIRVGAILFANGNLSFFSLEAGKRYMHTFSYPVAQ